nr:hypothetical protein [Tanacetum cinerariifolium]
MKYMRLPLPTTVALPRGMVTIVNSRPDSNGEKFFGTTVKAYRVVFFCQQQWTGVDLLNEVLGIVKGGGALAFKECESAAWNVRARWSTDCTGVANGVRKCPALYHDGYSKLRSWTLRLIPPPMFLLALLLKE